MSFLTTQNGGSNNSSGSGVSVYTSPVDNTSFTPDGDKFKATVTHKLNTNNMIVQVEDSGITSLANYKYISDDEIEIYYTSASDINVKVFGLQKTTNDSLSIIGMGTLGKIILGKTN